MGGGGPRAGGAEEVAKDDKDVVSAFRTALADRVGKERFELWFGANVRVEVSCGKLTVGAANPFLLDFLRVNFRGHLEAAAEVAAGRSVRVDFQVERPVSGPRGGASLGDRSTGDARAGHPGGGDAEPPLFRAASRSCRNGSSRRRFRNLESFVVGPSNRLAHAAAEMVVREPGELSPLLFCGSTGVGKTHLLEGVWTASRKARQRSSAVFLSAEKFTTDFLQALRGRGLPSFRRKYRDVDLLILDDLQFLCGKKCTQVELLYTIDTLLREGRQLVLAGDRPPREMGDFGPELATRLEGGMVCPIEPPDHQTRLGILAEMARRMEIRIAGPVAEFIASRLTRHARELSGALCRLKATAQATGKPISVPMAEEALGDMIRCSIRTVGLAEIDKAVCKTFGLEPHALQSRGKARRVTYPRMLAMWLARKYTRSALSEIGEHFGRRSHATVISAQKRVDGWLASDSSVQLASRTWNVGAAVRQLERSLRAG